MSFVSISPWLYYEVEFSASGSKALVIIRGSHGFVYFSLLLRKDGIWGRIIMLQPSLSCLYPKVLR